MSTDKIPNVVVISDIEYDEENGIDRVNIEISISYKELLNKGISGLYDPIFGGMKQLEEQLKELEYL